MHVITNMKFIQSSGSNCRTPYDGILQKNNWYYISFCHGNNLGEISLEINNTMINTIPETLRNNIEIYLKYKISNETKIFIAPCFPKAVKKRYANRLNDNLIFLATGNWDGQTGSSFYDGNDIPYTTDNKRKTDYPISQLIGDLDYMKSVNMANSKEHQMKFYQSYLSK